MIQRIIIHKSLLEKFKQEAKKFLPWEYIVALLGKQIDDEVYIHAFDKIEIDSWHNSNRKSTIVYWQPEEEIESCHHLKYFGTLHSHPYGSTRPSEDDIKGFREKYNDDEYKDGEHIGEQLQDTLMGIMLVERKKKVYQFGLSFYDIDLNPIEIIITETRKENRD